jgi:glucosamine 6-phosphate synthetase-like amidotransferase/phosphosugar isomerase protein
MCGLVGALAYGEFLEKRLERVRQESMIFLTTELLTLTQPRGKDATGVATMFADCDYMGLKMGISAQEFIARFGDTEEDYEGYLKIWRKKTRPAKISIGHCRKPSTGGASGPENNKNNHPIKIGDIIGVHNGTLTNHDKIFTNLGCKRDGNVDSEAIFRLLHHYTDNGNEPFTTQAMQETCKRISGSYAVMAFSGNNPFQMAAFRDGRPLEIAIIRSLKLVLIASEKDFLRMAIFRYNKMANLYQTGPFKFLSLTKDDVDVESLPDDSLFLFDIRREITAATKISDLFITEKVPTTGKIWVSAKSAITTNNWNVANNYHNNYNNVAKKTEVVATPLKQLAEPQKAIGQEPTKPTILTATSPENGKSDQRNCMVWNRSSSQYEAITGIEDTKKHGNVEINCDDGEIRDIKTNKVIVSGTNNEDKKNVGPPCNPGISNNGDKTASEFSLEESNEPIDSLISDPARISEVTISEPDNNSNACEDPVIAVFKNNPTPDPCDEFITHLEDITEITDLHEFMNAKENVVVDKQEDLFVKSTEVGTTEIDFSTHPDVLETATRVTREQLNFSNDVELANALEITNIPAMQSMEMYSLANRIKAFFYKRGWYSGYVARLKEEGNIDENFAARNILIRAQNKQKSAQATIRNMKSITRVFWSMLGKCPEHPTWDEIAVENAVKDTIGKGKSLNIDVLEKAFKPGDIQEIPVLSAILASVACKESK